MSLREAGRAAARAMSGDPRANAPLLLSLGLTALVVLALVLRLQLTGVPNADYIFYIGPWYDHLAAHGLAGFKEEFANYNFPYLFLLYITTILPVEKIVAFKLIGITFDFVLAAAVGLVVREVTGSRGRALFAGAATLYLPTVFINSSLWGQSDAAYTAFVLLSLVGVLKGRHLLAWVLFGVALAFKLQAIFFLPVLAYVWMKRMGPWYVPAAALPVYFLLSIPPVLFGRSLESTLAVYMDQYGAQPQLAANTPNAYFWLPQEMFVPFNRAGLVFAAGVVGLLFLMCVRYVPFRGKNLVYLSALFLLVVPFVLPQMHDRYFYGFEVLCLALAAIDRSTLWLVFGTQLATFSVYSSFLFGASPIPFHVLGVFLLFLVYFLVKAVVTLAQTREGAEGGGTANASGQRSSSSPQPSTEGGAASPPVLSADPSR